MTNETINYKQLLELAVLDAHGLLEPIESDLFNRSFHDAPASIQDEIIRLQHDFALDDSLLPSDEPAQSLRKRVLEAVAIAADSEAQRLAPLALIGARANAARAQFGSSKPVIYWRTVAMVLFGVTIVVAISAYQAIQRQTNITKYALNVKTSETIEQIIGVEFKKFLDNPYCNVTRLERQVGNPAGYLRVAINERFGDGYIIAFDLEKGEELIIQGTTSEGDVIELARISADSPIVGRGFKIDPALVRGMTITAVNAKTGNLWV